MCAEAAAFGGVEVSAASMGLGGWTVRHAAGTASWKWILQWRGRRDVHGMKGHAEATWSGN